MNIKYIVRKSDNVVVEVQNSRSPNENEYSTENVEYFQPLQDASGVYLYEVKNGQISSRDILKLPEHIDYKKQVKLDEIKQKANNIIVEKYPEWKQINLFADREFALGFIAKFKQTSNDSITSGLVDKLQGLSIDQLKVIRENFSSLDISDLISGIPADWVLEVTNQYKNIALSFIAYTLCKAIRSWSDIKEGLINATSTIEQLESISLEDYPVI